MCGIFVTSLYRHKKQREQNLACAGCLPNFFSIVWLVPDALQTFFRLSGLRQQITKLFFDCLACASRSPNIFLIVWLVPADSKLFFDCLAYANRSPNIFLIIWLAPNALQTKKRMCRQSFMNQTLFYKVPVLVVVPNVILLFFSWGVFLFIIKDLFVLFFRGITSGWMCFRLLGRALKLCLPRE